jgi:hypothetical protein
MNTKYTTHGHKAVFTTKDWGSQSEIAEHFALMKARKEFGRNGRVGACRVDGEMSDGSSFQVNAFIGYGAKDGTTTGHNVYFTVYRRTP